MNIFEAIIEDLMFLFTFPFITAIDFTFLVINQFDAVIGVFGQFLEILIPIAIFIILFGVLKSLFNGFFGSRSRIPLTTRRQQHLNAHQTLDERLNDRLNEAQIWKFDGELNSLRELKQDSENSIEFVPITMSYVKSPYNYCLLCQEDQQENESIYQCRSCLRLVCKDCYDDLKTTNMTKCPHCGQYTHTSLMEVK